MDKKVAVIVSIIDIGNELPDSKETFALSSLYAENVSDRKNKVNNSAHYGQDLWIST